MSLPSRADQLPPTLIQAYEAKEKLASSPGKATWLAVDRQTDRPVVIKLLFFDQHFDWQHHKLFEREAQVLQNLSHPSLPKFIKLIDFQDEQDNGFASVQSFIPGTSLAQSIKQGRTFSEEELRELAQKILEILDFLHSRNPPIIHRDIKPSNILLGDRTANSIGDIFLVDFDTVQTIMTPGSTRTVVGSYGYMPPEQFGGRVVPASDLYALGATLICLATGQQPADLPQRQLKLQFEPLVQLSPEFANWINQAIEPSLEERFSSANDALKALNQDNINHDAIVDRQSETLTLCSQTTSTDHIDSQQSEYRWFSYFSDPHVILHDSIVQLGIWLMITVGISILLL